MRFYRGISVAEDDRQSVIDAIKHEGLKDGGPRSGGSEVVDLRDRLYELFDCPDLSTEITRPSVWEENQKSRTRVLIGGYPVIYATGDEYGASYYAQVHNQTKANRAPILIAFDAPISGASVDGNDFLYNAVFQPNYHHKRREAAVAIYGEGILKYLEKAWGSDDHDYRIALCDLALQDLDVIKSHYDNQAVIEGRHGVHFCSTFKIKAPINSDQIVEVSDPDYQRRKPAYRTSDIFHLD